MSAVCFFLSLVAVTGFDIFFDTLPVIGRRSFLASPLLLSTSIIADNGPAQGTFKQVSGVTSAGDAAFKFEVPSTWFVSSSGVGRPGGTLLSAAVSVVQFF